MAWLAVDKDGLEGIYEEKPYRIMCNCSWVSKFNGISLPSGTIKKLIGRKLTWSDEPVEI